MMGQLTPHFGRQRQADNNDKGQDDAHLECGAYPKVNKHRVGRKAEEEEDKEEEEED